MPLINNVGSFVPLQNASRFTPPGNVNNRGASLSGVSGCLVRASNAVVSLVSEGNLFRLKSNDKDRVFLGGSSFERKTTNVTHDLQCLKQRCVSTLEACRYGKLFGA
jgi:hypothetical protein